MHSVCIYPHIVMAHVVLAKALLSAVQSDYIYPTISRVEKIPNQRFSSNGLMVRKQNGLNRDRHKIAQNKSGT